MSTVLLLSFLIPLALTLFAPGLRWLIAMTVLVAAAIGWQDYAYWAAANSADFVGPPKLPYLTNGAVALSAAGLAIGVLTRAIGHGFHTASGKPLNWPWLILVFIGVSAAVGAAYSAGLFRM